GGLLPPPLVQRRRVGRKLHAREVVRPDPDPEADEDPLFASRARPRHGRDGAIRRSAPRPAAMGLIDDVRRKSAPQKNTLVALPIVGSALPGLAELTAAVPHDARIPTR